MSDLQVVSAELDAVATDLTTVGADTRTTADACGVLRHSAHGVGQRDLGDAGDHFFDRWHYGLGCLADDTHTLTVMLHTTVRGFDDVEAQMTAALSGARP